MYRLIYSFGPGFVMRGYSTYWLPGDRALQRYRDLIREDARL